MSQSVVPIQIRKHLIPYFYKEFQGIEANYLNKKVKAAKINMNSSIGFLLQVTLEKSDKPVVADKFTMFISVTNFDGVRSADAKIFKCVSGKHSFLRVPDQINNRINDLLEDQFRVAFVSYIEGRLESDRKLKVRDAIIQFMEKYELDESGFEMRSLWRLLNREQKKERLSRMQNMSTNRVLNYKSA